MSRLAYACLIVLAVGRAAEFTAAQEGDMSDAAPKSVSEPVQQSEPDQPPSSDMNEEQTAREALGFLQAIGELFFGAEPVEFMDGGVVVAEPNFLDVMAADVEGDEVDVHAAELAVALFGLPEGAVIDMNIGEMRQNFDQEMRPQIEPILKSELYFLRMNCKLTPEQYQRLKKAGDKALSDVTSKVAAAQQQMMRGGFGLAQQRALPNAHALMTDALVAAVQELSSEVSTAGYLAELEKRKASRKQAAIQVLVAKLDRELLLTPEQRRQIAESLTAKYEVKWEAYLGQNFAFNDEYIRYPPDDRFVSFLTETQKSVFKACKKNANQNVFFGFEGNFVQGFLDPDAFQEPAAK